MTAAELVASASGADKADAKHVSVEHGTFRCRRGYDLYTTTFSPAVRRASACLVFHHGLSDHSTRHSAVLSHLCASLGMPVYSYDAHGHGLSGPHNGPVGRALITSFDHTVDDLIDFTREHVVPAECAALAAAATKAVGGDDGDGAFVRQGGGKQQRPRIYLLGYSMGGLTCCLAAALTAATPPVATVASAMAPYSSANRCRTAEAPAGPVGKGEDRAGPGSKPKAMPCTNGTANGHHASAAAAAANGGCQTAFANGHADADGNSSSRGDDSSDCSVSGSYGGGGSNTGADGTCADGSGGGGLYEGLMLTSGLTDPLYGTHPMMRLLQLAFVTVLSWVAPALPMFKRRPVESGIRDPAAVAEMAADTLWYRGNFKVATVASLLHGCARLRSVCRALGPLPLYVQHATVDTSCSLPSMTAFLGRVAPRQLEMHVVEGAFHDLHHDPETPVLLERMVDWLRRRVGQY